jgi:hypothetical protein
VLHQIISQTLLSDVHRGKYEGTDVAVKVLRTMTHGNPGAMKVSVTWTDAYVVPLLITHVGILPRNYRMEMPCTP